MKLFKVMAIVASLFAAGQSAHAVGVMEKSDVRDGQLVCMERATKDGRSLSAESRTREERGQPANAVGAQ